MISLESDYTTGAHPEILKAFADTNYQAEAGYGMDSYSKSAIDKIKKACECPEAEVYFAVGGTQTNQLVISTMVNYSAIELPEHLICASFACVDSVVCP